MTDSASLEVVVSGRGITEAERQLAKFTETGTKAEAAALGFNSSIKTVQNTAGLLAGGIAGIGLSAVAAAIITNTKEADAALAQLEATLASMGPGIGLTSEQLQQMAHDLQGLTTYGDDAIISMQSVLATFGNIKGDVFKDATIAIADMAAKLGGNLKDAALQVGKALNDPTEGLTALRRAGVSFTDSQKETIKRLTETGEVAKAQVMILKELQKEFGGSAAAARQTLGGALEALKVGFGDLFELSKTGSSGVVEVINDITSAVSDPDFKDGIATFAEASVVGLELLASVITGKVVVSIAASTKALYLNTTAQLANLAAEKEAAIAALALATANEKLAQEELYAANFAKAMTPGFYLNEVAMSDLVIKEQQYTAAIAARTAAQKAADAATASTRLGARALSGVLGALGGPAGLVITAATAFLLFSDNGEKASATTDELAERVAQLTGEYEELTNVQKKKTIDEITAAMKAQGDEIARVRKEAALQNGGSEVLGLTDIGRIKDATAEIQRLYELLQKLQPSETQKDSKIISEQELEGIQKHVKAIEEERDKIGLSEVALARYNAEKLVSIERAKLSKDASQATKDAFEEEAKKLVETAVAAAAAAEAVEKKKKADEDAKTAAEQLAKELETVENSFRSQSDAIVAIYDKNESVILASTKEFSEEQLDLLTKNNAAKTKALDDLHEQELERLSSGLLSEEDQIRASYEKRRNEINDSTILSSEEKIALLDMAFIDEQNKLKEHHEKLNEIARIYGGQLVEEYSTMMKSIEEVQGQSWQSQALTYTAVLENISREGSKQNRKMFELNKAAAIANTIVSTYAGAEKAIEQLGWWGYPMAALIVADGLARVQTIRNTSFGSGGGSGGSSGGGATGISGTGAVSRQEAPTAGANTTQQQSTGQTIIFYGDFYGNDAKKLFQEFKDLISKADQVLIESTSANGIILNQQRTGT